MGFLKKYFKHYKKDIFVGQSFKLIEAILELLLPLVMAALVDGIAGGTTHDIVMRALLMLLISAVGVGTALVCQVTASRASQSFGTELRHDVFSHITTLSAADLEHFGTAGLVTRMTGDINQLQSALAMLIRLVVRAPFLAIGSIVMAIILDINLSVVFLVATPLICVVIWAVMKASLPYFKRMQKGTDTLGRVTRENLSGARVVRAFNAQQDETARFNEAAKGYTAVALRSGHLNALLSPATTIIMDLGIIAVLLLGGQRAQLGLLSQGIIIAFINYLLQILTQTAIVANLIVLFTKAGASAQRIGELLFMKPSIQEAESTEDLDPAAPAVTFDHVSFRYPAGGEDAVHDISFTLRKGASLGIIGGTGSGKSTLASLFSRTYDITQGSIRLFGTDIRRVPLSRLRATVGIVPQHAALFSGSIRDNMRLGNEQAADDEIRAALKTAQALDFVEKKPGQLDYVLEEGAKDLSGGQKQRLTIARALTQKPEVLILDDSASALDMRTDSLLRAALKECDMTRVIISQRVSAIMDADQILVLDDGAPVGLGTHEQLLDNCPVYRETYLSQTKESGVNA